MKRFNRPSRYRFLQGVGWAALALMGIHGLRWIESSLCAAIRVRLPLECVVVPSFVDVALSGVAVAGCLYSAYRYYRDFYKGDYYVDLVESGH